MDCWYWSRNGNSSQIHKAASQCFDLQVHKVRCYSQVKKGGAGRDAYRSLMWDVPITTADLCDDQNIELQKEVATLKHQIEDLEKAAMCTPNVNKRKPLSECSQSQIRKRKKVVVEDFSSSISWMPKEIGLVPHFKPSICI